MIKLSILSEDSTHIVFDQTPVAGARAATGAESVHWDLSDLYDNTDELHKDLEKCEEMAHEFAESFRGRVGHLSAEEFALAMAELEVIQDTAGRAFTFVYLNWSTDTGQAERGALLQQVREAYTRISTLLLFFDLEWADLDDEQVEKILRGDEANRYRHHLEVLRLSRPYLLTEPEEKILVEKSITGRTAWNRFFDEYLGDIRYLMDGKNLTQQQVLALLHDVDREIRSAAAQSFTDGLVASIRPLTYIFNTILADKATDDRLRGYPNWISSRNLSNEVDDKTVDALVDAVVSGYPIVSRYYAIKQRVLGLTEMFDYDRYAPVGESNRIITWQEARETVTSSYAGFDSRLGDIVEMFFDNNWIDAALGQNKSSGAFSHGAVPSVHPYIMMNYTGRVRDVQTLAHELGHGVHQYLSRRQGIFQADTPLTTAETASVFGEMLVFQKLLVEESDPENRLAMLMGKIDDTFATVFRQVSMNRFEDRIHGMRREEGELSSDQLSDIWMETQSAMFGSSIQLTDNYRSWWSYIPHFLHTPGYVYAYAFGELLVLALYERYTEIGDSFAEEYVGLLSSGGSDWPHVLVGKLGIDLQDPEFWSAGVRSIGALVDEAEALASELY